MGNYFIPLWKRLGEVKYSEVAQPAHNIVHYTTIIIIYQLVAKSYFFCIHIVMFKGNLRGQQGIKRRPRFLDFRPGMVIIE